MLKRIAITSLAAAAVFSTATVAMAPVTPAAAQVSVVFGSPPPPLSMRWFRRRVPAMSGRRVTTG